MSVGDATAFPDLTQTRMLSELTNKLHTVFEDLVVKTRSGYWLHEFVFNATIGKNRYRIPPRSVVGGLDAVLISDGTGQPFYDIDQVPASDLAQYEGNPGRAGQPYVYAIIGDQVEMVPTPTVAFPIKFTYYARPSQLMPSQNLRTVSGSRGLIVALNTTTRALTLDAIPYNMDQPTPSAITSGSIVDIVHPNGWHELSMINVTQVYTGTTMTITSTDDMGDVQVGDYVRAADQTDWPCLPDDFHRCLCDATAVKMLLEMNLTEKSDSIGQNNGNDLARFKSLLYPRVRASPKMLGIMRRSRFGVGWPYGRIWG